MATRDDGLYAALLQRGLSRRTCLKFGAAMAAALAMPLEYSAQIVRAVEAAPRVPLVWLHGQACGGNNQAFLQSTEPTTADLLLQTISVEYDDALAAGSGDPSGAYPDGFLLAVDGAIPTAQGGLHATIGGRPIVEILRALAPKARATIAVGSCAFDGGASAVAGGQTGAVGVGQVIGGRNLLNLPGCPVNGQNLAAAIVHYVTFGQLPPADGRGRPFFAYGGLIHNQCERRAHFEYGEFATKWGDEGSQKGWCLYRLGCKGPQTFANCPTAKYAGGTSWNVLAGHGCIGCATPGFWDAMGGAYERLPATIAYAPNISADQLGLALVGGVGALAAAHGGASVVRSWRNRRIAARASEVAAPEEPQSIEERMPIEKSGEPSAEVETSDEQVAVEPEAAEEPAADEPDATNLPAAETAS